jgi:hypothetical protein
MGPTDQEDDSPGHTNEASSVLTNPTTPWSSGLGDRTQTAPSGPANAPPDWSATIIGACEDCDATALELYVAVYAMDESGPRR